MREEIWNIIVKRLSDTETSDSKTDLDNWLAKSEENVRKYHEVAIIWHLSARVKPAAEKDSFISSTRLQVSQPTIETKKLWRYGLAAATVAALLFLGIWFKNNTEPKPVVEWTTQTAGLGRMVSVTLPDHSIVILNSGSSIRYQKKFKHTNQRLVQLSGEAFFEVAHQTRQPFVVESGKIKTVVYGTSFNVRAYPDERNIQVAVKSGKVGVLRNDTKSDPIFLLPNNSIKFDTKGASFSGVAKNSTAGDDWKNGSLIFDQAPLSEVLAALSRRFNVKFNTEQCLKDTCPLTARFVNQDLKSILKTIQNVMGMKMTKINETIYLKGGKTCKEN